MLKAYRQFTQLAAVVVGSAGFVLAMLAEPVIYVWTGDENVVNKVAPIVRLYALGNICLAFASFPYYLQYALGDLKLHLIGNLVFAIILVPAVVIATSTYGAEGAGWVWFISNLLFFVFWTSLVHRRFQPALNFEWLRIDIFRVMSFSAPTLVAASLVIDGLKATRVEMAFIILVVSILGLSMSILRSTEITSWMAKRRLL
jgi:O-antigen/teichoic acid export membrane protein